MNTLVPLNDLSRLHAPIMEELRQAIDRVLTSGWYLRGRETAAFEAAWAEQCGQSYCVSCASGTDALTIAATALGMREASVQDNTLPLTAIGLHRAGVHLRLVDVDGDGRVREADRQYVPVLLYGRLPRGDEQDCTLYDAAHAHGWKPGPRAVACWSFYPSKTLGALGDAGAVTTNDQGLADTMRNLAGRDDVMRNDRQLTSRMDEMQAAVLSVKLRSLPAWLQARRQVAEHYAARLPPSIRQVSDVATDLHHLAVVQTPQRDELAAFLRRRGIETKIHFPIPLHDQAAPWADAAHAYPGADAWCGSVLSLPCFPGIDEQELTRVTDAITQFAEER